MKILHIVSQVPKGLVRETIERQSTGHEVTIVLTQHAGKNAHLNGRVLFLTEEDPGESLPSGCPEIGYNELMEMIFSHDHVLCW